MKLNLASHEVTKLPVRPAQRESAWSPYFIRGWTLLKLKGERAAFVRDEEKAVAMADIPSNQSALAAAHTLAGRTADARKIVEEKIEEATKQRHVDPGIFAGCISFWAIRIGPCENQAYQDRFPTMTLLNLPNADAMRSEPRFIALVKRSVSHTEAQRVDENAVVAVRRQSFHLDFFKSEPD